MAIEATSWSYNCSSKLTSQFNRRRHHGNDGQAHHHPRHIIKQDEASNSAVSGESSSRHHEVEQKPEKQEMHHSDIHGSSEDNSAQSDSFQFDFDNATGHYVRSSKGFSFGFIVPEMSMDSPPPIPPTVQQHKSSKKSRKKKKKKKKKKTNSNANNNVKNNRHEHGPESALHDATDLDAKKLCDKVYNDSKDPSFAAQKPNVHPKRLSKDSPLTSQEYDIPTSPKMSLIQPITTSKKMASKSGEKPTVFQFDAEVRHRGAMVNKQSMGLHRQNRSLHQQRGKLHTHEKNPFTFGFSGILPS